MFSAFTGNIIYITFENPRENKQQQKYRERKLNDLFRGEGGSHKTVIVKNGTKLIY